MKHLRWKDICPKGETHLVSALTWSRRETTFDHDHDFPELFLMERGRAIHRINGREQELREGDLVLIRPPDRHCFHAPAGEPFRYANVAFARATLAYLRARYFSRERGFWGARNPLPAVHRLPARVAKPVSEAIERLSRRPKTRFEIERFLLFVLGELAAPARADAEGAPPEWLLRACERIQRPEHFGRGVDEFVRLAGRSAEHASRVTRRLTGRTPTDWVNDARMDYAAQLLSVGDRKIAEIALDCGVANLGHFYALFRKRHGCAPRRYRMQSRAATP
ncbi:MAG: AraC family transcriptional regulator [Planctomycetota bacterium]|nr:AraC family transcriptional regulator [Planctomycetota bacterium]